MINRKGILIFPQQNQTSVTQTINKRFKGGADLRLYHELNKQKSIYPSIASFNRSQHEQSIGISLSYYLLGKNTGDYQQDQLDIASLNQQIQELRIADDMEHHIYTIILDLLFKPSLL